MKSLPEMIARWVPGGSDAAGHRRLRPQREPRVAAALLRGGRGVITLAALEQLAAARRGAAEQVERAIKELGIDPEKADPVRA